MNKKQFDYLRYEIHEYLPGIDFVYDKKTKTAMAQNGKEKVSSIQIPVHVLFDIFADYEVKSRPDYFSNLDPY